MPGSATKVAKTDPGHGADGRGKNGLGRQDTFDPIAPAHADDRRKNAKQQDQYPEMPAGRLLTKAHLYQKNEQQQRRDERQRNEEHRVGPVLRPLLTRS